MAEPRLRILIPALIAGPLDEARLAATLAGLPRGLDAVAHLLIQREEAPHDGRVVGGPARPDLPVVAHELGPPSGKWGALREGLRRCGPAPFIAIADGDDAYELDVLAAMLRRLEADEADLIQGARTRILLDDTELGRRRARLEPVVNELLRLRCAARGAPLPADVSDLQSGLCVARRELLARFLARTRMDGLEPREPEEALPWGFYGGELHLHAFAAAVRARVRAHPVRERYGRPSGQTPAAIGRQLTASVLFAGTTAAQLEAGLAGAAAREGWDAATTAAARRVAREAFPTAR